MATTVQLRTRISEAHRKALDALEQVESLPTGTLISVLIFNRARALGVWPVNKGEDDAEPADIASTN